jgi:hypothetical protein
MEREASIRRDASKSRDANINKESSNSRDASNIANYKKRFVVILLFKSAINSSG